MKPGVRYFAVAAAVALIGAVLAWIGRAHPALVTFFGIWLVILPTVLLICLGLLELCLGPLGSGAGDGSDPGKSASVVELARKRAFTPLESSAAQTDRAAA